ncbi:MAG: NAD(P)/FAD-dependent oxidoreductase [Mycobacteriales bacterium]
MPHRSSRRCSWHPDGLRCRWAAPPGRLISASGHDRQLGVAVIGAGPGGLSVGAELARRGVPAAIIDRAPTVGASWRGHYDRLHLHTVRWLSGLPGLTIPRRYGPWVGRDQVIEYLESYAAHHGLDVRFQVTVERIDRDPAGWVLRTTAGDWPATAVVVATGYNHTARLPDWPGSDGFTAKLAHAASYRNGRPYAGQDVLVVGAGNTGAEIAVDLVECGASRVRIAVRTPPHVVRRSMHGVPTTLTSVATRHLPGSVMDPVAGWLGRMTVGDLSAYGLPEPPVGVYTRVRREGQIPILDVGFIDAVRAGSVTVVAAVEAFDGPDVVLADGSRIRPDAVIAATGYDRGLAPLVGHLGVLDPAGRPTVHGGRSHPSAPGLYFTGYTNPISGMFRELRLDARRIAREVARSERRGPIAPR